MVATVSPITSASATAEYFYSEGFYFTRGDPNPEKRRELRNASRWHGQAADTLPLGRTVAPSAFEKVLKGYVPGTDIRLGRMRDGKHQHRPGVDITFSPPKSVSLEALVRGDNTVLWAHDEAVRAALDYIERELLVTRVYDPVTKRRERVPAQGMVAALFRHLASRNGDPQLHTHCVIANMCRGPNGDWRSLDMGGLHRARHLIGAIYRDKLAERLRAKGFSLVPSKVGHVPSFEIAGYSKGVLDAFSSRRREIVEFIEANGWSYNTRTAQKATLETRKRKEEPVRGELQRRWQKIAAKVDFEVGDLAARRRRRARRAKREQPSDVPSALEIVVRAAADLEERASVFAHRELLTMSLGQSPGRHGIEAIEAAIVQLVDDSHLKKATRPGVGDAYVTDRTLRSEREVLKRVADGVDASEPLADAAEVHESLADSRLTAGQRKAVETILLSGHRTVGIQGYAGTGKTTMLKEVLEHSGTRQVIGLAPSASAAGTLSREAGIPARTLQWFLTRYRDVADGVMEAGALEELRERFAGTVVVVDEMSMVSTAQARDLLRIADRLDIDRLVLVGDRKQLRAIGAGQPFRLLQDAGMPTAHMDDILRQRNESLKAAVHDAVAGDPTRALAQLEDKVVEVPTDEFGETAARIWLNLSTDERVGTAILAPTRELRAQINEAVREGLRDEGVLSGEALEIETLVNLHLTPAQKADAANYREGDVCLFHRDLYNYRIKAGDACTVTAVDEEEESGVVRLVHPDGTARHVRRPSAPVRSSFDVFEPTDVAIEAGDRIRWTRDDVERRLIEDEQARILEIDTDAGTVGLERQDGQALTLANDDPQLRHFELAYAGGSIQGGNFSHVRLMHPDGKFRTIRPSEEDRRHYEMFEPAKVSIQAGERIRWTRNDNERRLLNGEEARILGIDFNEKTVTLQTQDGRKLTLGHDDGQLRHIVHAYASTVHAAQGATVDNVIAVLDSGFGALTDQCTFYVEISRARENAIVLTDNREQLADTLEANKGIRLTATEALERSPEEIMTNIRNGLEPVLPKAEPEEPVERHLAREAEHAARRAESVEAVFADWQRQRDEHAASAARAGRHPSEHGGYRGLGERLRMLATTTAVPAALRRKLGNAIERHEAQAEVPERARRCVEAIELGLEHRQRLGVRDNDSETAAADVTADPGYEDWRLSVEAAVVTAERELVPAGPHHAGSGGPLGRLQAAATRARKQLDRDDRSIAVRRAVERAADWERVPTPTADADAFRQLDEPETQSVIARIRLSLADPALPEAQRETATMRIDAHEVLVEYRDWVARAGKMEEGDSTILSHPGFGALVEDGERIVANSALRTSLMEQLEAVLVALRPRKRALDRSVEIRAGIDKTLAKLDKGRAEGLGAEEITLLYEELDAHRSRAHHLVEHNPPPGPERQLLLATLQEADARAGYSAFELAWNQHHERSLASDRHQFEAEGVEELIEQARFLTEDPDLDGELKSVLLGLSEEFAGYWRKRCTAALKRWAEVEQDALDEGRSPFAQSDAETVIGEMESVNRHASSLLDDQCEAIGRVLDDYAEYRTQRRNRRWKSDFTM